MATLENAILLAVKAHRGQVDRAGKPYILHPLRIMCHMRTTEEMIVAILHDVVEDTDITLEDLRKAGYSEEILEAVDCLTKREGEAYTDYLARIKPNPLAIRVKLGDLEDNMDIRRITKIKEKDLERLQKYRDAWEMLALEL